MAKTSEEWLKEHNLIVDKKYLSPTRTNIYLSHEISQAEAGEYLELEGYTCAVAPVGFYAVRKDDKTGKWFIYVDDSTD